MAERVDFRGVFLPPNSKKGNSGGPSSFHDIASRRLKERNKIALNFYHTRSYATWYLVTTVEHSARFQSTRHNTQG